MALLVGARGDRPSVTLGGSLEVVAVGAGYGLLGGLLAVGIDTVLRRRPTWLQHCLLALGLLAIAWFTSRAGRSAATGLGTQRWLAVGLAVTCFVGYGLLLRGLLRRWGPRDGDHRARSAEP